MPRVKHEPMIYLEPKTEEGKKKLAYHGNKWYLRGTETSLKIANRGVPVYVCRSRDGSKILFVRQKDDPDFNVRLL